MPRKNLDIAQMAHQVVEWATSDKKPAEASGPPEKNPKKAKAGRAGGLKGGKSRAKHLSPSRRKSIARKAAQARWGNKSNTP